MFTKEEFEALGDVFSLARAKTVDLDINNKGGLVQLINFEESLKTKMIDVIQTEKAQKSEVSCTKETPILELDTDTPTANED